MRIPYLADSRPQSRLESFAYIVSFSVLMALLARVSFPLPFTPVPITGQNLGVLLAGLLLGAPQAALAMLLYLAEGAAGLPVFSPAGPGGLAQLLGPTGGFLLSYPLAAFAVARLVRVVRYPAVAILAGEVIIFSFGAAWLWMLIRQPATTVLQAAVLPFLPGEAIKCAAVFALASFLRARHRS